MLTVSFFKLLHSPNKYLFAILRQNFGLITSSSLSLSGLQQLHLHKCIILYVNVLILTETAPKHMSLSYIINE